MDKVKFTPQMTQTREGMIKGMPLVITYHPLLKSVDKMIQNHFYLLYTDNEIKKVFSLTPMFSFKNARKLRSYLVRAKLYTLYRSERRCKKPRCKVCVNVIKTDTFTSIVTSKTYKINHHFDCDEK